MEAATALHPAGLSFGGFLGLIAGGVDARAQVGDQAWVGLECHDVSHTSSSSRCLLSGSQGS